MYAKTRPWFVGCAFALAFVSGCVLQKKDDAQAFREAVPQQDAIALAGPDGANGSTGAASAAPSRKTLGTTPATHYAKWYGFTREMREGVNKVTAAVLGSVWLIIQSEPSTTTADSASWGPWTDELSPATYRFTVTRLAQDDYEYVLEGRLKDETSEAAYRVVLKGEGFGKPSPKHGQGTFKIDLDVGRALDPFGNENNSGIIVVDYDLPRDFSERLGALPRTINAAVTPKGEAHYTVKSVANEDHTGVIHVDAHVDTDDSKLTALEDVVIDSRWQASGAGRADIDVAGGDLPVSVAMVDVVECWGADFTQSYYTDSAGISATIGNASDCVYADK